MEQMDHPRFGDFAGEKGPLDGEKKKLSEILDKEILVLAFRVGKSKFKDKNYVTIQFENSGSRYVVFTGSEVLTEQLKRHQEQLPFYTTIVKRFNYFALT